MPGAVPKLRSPVAVPVLKQEDTAGAGEMGPGPLLAAAAFASSSNRLPLSPADAALAQQMAQVNGAPLDAEVSAGPCLERMIWCQHHAQLVCPSLSPSDMAHTFWTLVAMLCCPLAVCLSPPQPARCR